MKKFDINNTPIDGPAMLEASAGTGKTYSVAILVLRLILEKNIPIEKILMVTFTNAAVAELELRIREFVRKAFRYAKNGDDCEQEIMDAVNKPGIKDPLPKLKNAIQSLDNLSTLTINSFCQKTIGEFTFETNQSFDYEIVTEDSFILKNASNRFVRETLNVMDYEKFQELWKDLKVEKMHELLRNHLQGMKFADSQLKEGDDLDKIKKLIKDKNEEFDKFIRSKFPKVISLDSKRDSLKKEAKNGNSQIFRDIFIKQLKKNQKDRADYFEHYGFMEEEFIEHMKAVERAESELFNFFYIKFFQQAEKQINETKQKNGYISYDDQIKTLHSALGNDDFIANLKEKYDAVFIDEFQDTDKYQYEIFSKTFEGKSLFYIGDPKQSIYGWRSADLDTYKEAKRAVGENNIHTLKRNFRSTPRLLDALEKLMDPGNGFNMFQDDAICFEKVAAGRGEMGELNVNKKPVVPVTIWHFDADDFETNYAAVAQEVYTLLTGDASINTGDASINKKKIKPQDIGILVRDNSDGRTMKKALAGFNIPSVQRDDTKVLKSDEAIQIRYLIQAVLNPKRGPIFRAIHYKPFGFTSEQLKALDEQAHIDYFIALKKTLSEKGVFNMIAQFLDIYGVRQRCSSDVLGQRVLTNINQTAEILHRLEKKAKLLPDDLVVWLQRAKDDANEEFQQRIESDDDAVQISTIHKAKGLQYKIVFAPGLCMIPKKKFLEKNNVNTFKKDGTYFFTFNYKALPADDQKLHDLQKEQENQRLIYVALTRAAYKCYISYLPRKYYNSYVKSSFDDLFTRLDKSSDNIEIVDLTEGKFLRIKGDYQKDILKKDDFSEEQSSDKDESPIKEFSPRPVKLKTDGIQVPLQLHSFSGLRGKGHSVPFEVLTIDNDYDQFIFQDLPRGATAGSALHSIFERLHFQEPGTWEQTLKDAATYYKSVLKEEWKQHFIDMVEHTMQAEIAFKGDSFRLADINDSRKIMEMQFNFSLKNSVSKETIDQLLGDVARLGGDASLQGLMTGFVDLIFEHNNKFYILDWKSNYLGNTLEDYSQQAVKKAMIASNYTLQYLIYTVAVKRWLESRLPDFDYDRDFGGVIYLYLRGIRQGKETGIYFSKPETEKIQALDALLS